MLLPSHVTERTLAVLTLQLSFSLRVAPLHTHRPACILAIRRINLPSLQPGASRAFHSAHVPSIRQDTITMALHIPRTGASLRRSGSASSMGQYATHINQDDDLQPINRSRRNSMSSVTAQTSGSAGSAPLVSVGLSCLKLQYELTFHQGHPDQRLFHRC